MASRRAFKLAQNVQPWNKFIKLRRWSGQGAVCSDSNGIPSCDIYSRSFSSRPPLPQAKILTDFPSSNFLSARFSIWEGPWASKRSYNAAAEYPPFQEIGMPSLSPTMTQGNIVKWRKSIGDAVSAGDVLCEIETDKATLEMESMEDGFVARILRDEGSKDIPVGEPIILLVDSEEDIPKLADYSVGAKPTDAPSSPSPPVSAPPPKVEEAPKEEPPMTQTSSPTPSTTPPSTGRIFATPAARKLAEDNKVEISQLKGTGPEGRILKADVEEFIAKSASTKPLPSPSASYTDIPTSQIRKVIASRLLQSKQTIPHYYLSQDVRVDKLNLIRSELNAIQEKSNGPKISLNDFIIKAAAMACIKVPECNSSWVGDFIRQYQNVDVNVAVQTDNGLMVPFVKSANLKGLSSISSEVKRLALAAREGNLKPEEFQGGTFSVSNLGMFGIKSFSAVINPPQAAILAVGAAQKRVIPGSKPDEYEVATVVNITLSCDHRVVDGAVGALWLNAFQSYIENPITLIL